MHPPWHRRGSEACVRSSVRGELGRSYSYTRKHVTGTWNVLSSCILKHPDPTPMTRAFYPWGLRLPYHLFFCPCCFYVAIHVSSVGATATLPYFCDPPIGSVESVHLARHATCCGKLQADVTPSFRREELWEFRNRSKVAVLTNCFAYVLVVFMGPPYPYSYTRGA